MSSQPQGTERRPEPTEPDGDGPAITATREITVAPAGGAGTLPTAVDGEGRPVGHASAASGEELALAGLPHDDWTQADQLARARLNPATKKLTKTIGVVLLALLLAPLLYTLITAMTQLADAPALAP